LAAGLGLGFLLAQRDPTFYSADSLQEVAGLPVYGVIGRANNVTSLWDVRFGLALGALLIAYVLVATLGGRGITG
jgi:hypothetical protein